MENKLRLSGLLFAGVFLAGFLLNLVFTNLRGDSLVVSLFSLNQLSLLASIVLFLLSSFVAPLRWIQPVIFLVSASFVVIPEPHSIYGLGFFLMGVFLIERAGFFLKHRGPKIAIIGAYLFVLEIAAVFVTKRPIFDAVAPTFFIAALALFLWFLYKDKLVIFLKEPKARLSLGEKGLATSEITYVRALVAGLGAKEIAAEYEVAESTVRNTLARAYKKLDVENQGGVMVLAEKFEIVD